MTLPLTYPISLRSMGPFPLPLCGSGRLGIQK